MVGKTPVAFASAVLAVTVVIVRFCVMAPKSSGLYGAIRWNGPDVGGLPLLCCVINEPARLLFRLFWRRRPHQSANPTMAAMPRTEPMTAPAMAPLFALFFEDSPSTAAPDEVDSDAGLALSAVARVEDAAELCDLEELELEVEVDELLELEDKEIEDDEDITDVVEEIALLLEADDVVLAAADTGLKFTPVKTICKSTSEACPS